MRTHIQIITDATGPHGLAQIIAPIIGGDPEVVRKRVWAWNKAESIPGEYWALLERSGVATVAELSEAAEARKLPSIAEARAKRTRRARAPKQGAAA